METVIFIIRKSDNSFRSYSILKHDKEKVDEIISNFNKREDNKDRAEIVTDPHVIAAITCKDSDDTIKSHSADVKETFSRLRNETEDQFRCIANSIERMMEYIQEKIEDRAADTKETV